MQSHVSQISPVEVEIKVEFSWDDVRQDMERTFQQLQRTATVRGFRKGKAPKHLLEQLYGDKVREQVSATLIERGLLSAVQEHGLRPVAAAHVHPPHLKQGEPLTFTAKLEVQPTVETVNAESLQVELPEIKIVPEDIERELQRLRSQHAELVTPEIERPVMADDVVTINYTVEIDAKPHPDLSSEGRTWELGSGRVLPELESGMLGMKLNEAKSIPVTLPEDQGQAEFRGKKATFHITITGLQQKQLPELDDEFAKDIGNFETLVDLKAEIETQLRANAERESTSLLRERLVDQLVSKNPIAVPPSLVAQQQTSMLQELAGLTQAFGTDFQWTEEMRADLHQRAERKVRTALLFGALAKQQKIEVSAQDLEDKFAELAKTSGSHIAKVKAKYQDRERELLMSQIAEDRIFEYLKNQATITQAKPTPSGAKAK
jgi:trigger factor